MLIVRLLNVPGADVVADVAAEDPVAEHGPQLARNGAAIFNRLIRDAQAREHLIAVGERAGGAQIEASTAGAAMIAIGLQRYVEFDVGENLGEEKIRAVVAVQNHR